jgi:hypothetical protein
MSAFNPWRCQPRRRRCDPKHRLEGFESIEETRKRRRVLIRVLKNAGGEYKHIALKLWRCRKDQRCLLPFCPRCVRQYRRWFIDQTIRCLESRHVKFVTLVPPRYRIPVGELDTFDTPRAKETLRRQIGRAGLTNAIVIGGVDFSYCEHAEDLFEPHWRPHYHLLVAGARRKEIRNALSRYYPKDEVTPRPIRIQPVTDLMPLIGYTMKPSFGMRRSYTDKDGRQNSWQYPYLPMERLREISMLLSRFTLTDRMVLKGVRRQGNKLVVRDRVDGEKR